MAGRRLVGALKAQIPSIVRIHPHGQVQRRDRGGQCGGLGTRNVCGKLLSCPGPDVWMNVGEWATGSALNLVSKETLPRLPGQLPGAGFRAVQPGVRSRRFLALKPVPQTPQASDARHRLLSADGQTPIPIPGTCCRTHLRVGKGPG